MRRGKQLDSTAEDAAAAVACSWQMIFVCHTRSSRRMPAVRGLTCSGPGPASGSAGFSFCLGLSPPTAELGRFAALCSSSSVLFCWPAPFCSSVSWSDNPAVFSRARRAASSCSAPDGHNTAVEHTV